MIYGLYIPSRIFIFNSNNNLWSYFAARSFIIIIPTSSEENDKKHFLLSDKSVAVNLSRSVEFFRNVFQ